MDDFCVIYNEDHNETARNPEINYNINHPSTPIGVNVVESYSIISWSELLFKFTLIFIPLIWIITCALWLTKTVTKSDDGSLLDQWVTGLFVFSFVISILFGCVFLIKSDRAYKFEFEPKEPLESNN
jgi:hypothetical protein